MLGKAEIKLEAQHKVNMDQSLEPIYIFSSFCSGDFRWRFIKGNRTSMHLCQYCASYINTLYTYGLVKCSCKNCKDTVRE